MFGAIQRQSRVCSLDWMDSGWGRAYKCTRKVSHVMAANGVRFFVSVEDGINYTERRGGG